MDHKDLLDQLDGHLASADLAWLVGAGISVGGNVPLMYPLTERVLAILEGTASPSLTLVRSLQDDLSPDCHVEHILSHLGDYAALAERSKTNTVQIGGATLAPSALEAAHGEIVNAIAETLRWGYVPASKDGSTPERIGSRGDSITDVAHHCAFVDACFGTSRAGLHERRGPMRFFTTNYDTLIEDALALCRVPCWDGFDGGAIAFRSFRLGDGEPPQSLPAQVIKLHGSIDWHLGEKDGMIWRVRDGDGYPAAGQRVLIYPQATKYLAAQRDPFAAQFDLLRRTLASPADNVLAVCGYSFGDDHINQEIELALSRSDSKTTLLAFCREGATGLPDCIVRWRNGPWGARVYVATQKGLYVGKDPPAFHEASTERSWWSLAGVTDVLCNGAGSIV